MCDHIRQIKRNLATFTAKPRQRPRSHVDPPHGRCFAAEVMMSSSRRGDRPGGLLFWGINGAHRGALTGANLVSSMFGRIECRISCPAGAPGLWTRCDNSPGSFCFLLCCQRNEKNMPLADLIKQINLDPTTVKKKNLISR